MPQSIASIAAAQANPALDRVRTAQKATLRELREGIEGLQRSQGWVPSGRRLISLGTLELLLGLETPIADLNRVSWLGLSERHLTEGLAVHPYDGTAWFRLAQVRQNKGDGRAIAAALMQSVDMAPSERSLWFGRAIGLLAYSQFLNADETEAAMSQLRAFWRLGRPENVERFVAAAIAMGKTDTIAVALRNDLEATTLFEKFRRDLSPLPVQPKK